MVEALSVAIPWSPLLTELCPAPVSTISTGGVQVVAEFASLLGCCRSGVGVVDVVVVAVAVADDVAGVAVPGVDDDACVCADPAEEGCGTSSSAGAGDASEGESGCCGLS